jgi:hypothetical protein
MLDERRNVSAFTVEYDELMSLHSIAKHVRSRSTSRKCKMQSDTDNTQCEDAVT